MKYEGRRMKSACTVCVILFFILHHSSFILSQETEPPKKPGVKLLFVPPPMEGTISLGIYDAKGKLVRTLHREAEVAGSEFGQALNGLVTYWDGKNDAGSQTPAGKYFARGFMVGDVKCEGVAFHFNDWLEYEKLFRFRRLISLCRGFHSVIFDAQKQNNEGALFGCDLGGKICGILGGSAKNISVRNNKIVIQTGSNTEELALPSISHPIAVAESRDSDDGLWVIDQAGTNTELKEFTYSGQFLRRMEIEESEFKTVQIAESMNDDVIFLLEESSDAQRLRALSLVTTGTNGSVELATSTWKVIFQKTITFSDTLDAVRDKLKFPNGQPFVPQEKIKVELQTNLLTPDQPASADIGIGLDAKGSFLKTADGLELVRVSETPNLRWAALGRAKDSRVVTLFQSDGAVVEEFKVRGLASMMAFDCGDFDYDPAKDK